MFVASILGDEMALCKGDKLIVPQKALWLLVSGVVSS